MFGLYWSELGEKKNNTNKNILSQSHAGSIKSFCIFSLFFVVKKPDNNLGLVLLLCTNSDILGDESVKIFRDDGKRKAKGGGGPGWKFQQ